MKIISIVFDNYLAGWIIGCAQKNKVTVSELIRNLLYTKMQQGSIVINYRNKLNQRNDYNEITRRGIGYIIFTAKLLEKLILTTEEQGEILHNLAFEETQVLLEQMNFNSKKQRFCISLEEIIFTWITSEANRLQIKVIPLIRKLLESIFIENQIKETTDISEITFAQKISIKYQVMAYTLLEKLVNHTIKDAGSIIQEAQSKAEDLLLKLCL